MLVMSIGLTDTSSSVNCMDLQGLQANIVLCMCDGVHVQFHMGDTASDSTHAGKRWSL